VRHVLIFAVLIGCLIWVAIYGLGPNLKGVTKANNPNAMGGLGESIAHGMSYPGS